MILLKDDWKRDLLRFLACRAGKRRDEKTATKEEEAAELMKQNIQRADPKSTGFSAPPVSGSVDEQQALRNRIVHIFLPEVTAVILFQTKAPLEMRVRVKIFNLPCAG